MRSKGDCRDGEHNYGLMTWDFYPGRLCGLHGYRLYHDKDFDRAWSWAWAMAFIFRDYASGCESTFPPC